jgi:predicted RNA binding protein YcfA (HicA-like mRNA interferase family)
VGLKKSEIEKLLKKNGFEMKPGNRHDIWKKTGFPPIPVPRHKGDIPKGTAQRILKDAGIKK